jgi:hypothetical protein
LADAHLSMDEWIQLSRVNRVATTLFGRDRRAADAWGQMAWVKWQYEGIEPEDLAVCRAPGLAKRLGRGPKLKTKHKTPQGL